jgi:hypothetical protein
MALQPLTAIDRDPIRDEDDLEERLSRPTPAVVETLARLRGDLVVVGASGKMGPSLARMARRALDEAGSRSAVVGVGRFANPRARAALERAGVRCLAVDLLAPDVVRSLPEAAAVVFMAGIKFGSG